MEKGWRRHRRTEHNVPLPKKLAPSLLEAGPSSVGRNPVTMTQHSAAAPLGHKALVIRVERFSLGLCLLILIRWPVCGKRGQQQAHVQSRRRGEVWSKWAVVPYLDTDFDEPLRQAIECGAHGSRRWQ